MLCLILYWFNFVQNASPYPSVSNANFLPAAQACGISFSKIGCFADKRRPFPKLLMTQRNNIDWQNWHEFLERQVFVDVSEQLKMTCSRTSADLHHPVGRHSQSWSQSHTDMHGVYCSDIFVPAIFRMKGHWTVWV